MLQRECSKVRRHLIHALNASILGTMGPSTAAWLAGHYEVHPEGRISLQFKNGTRKSPFLGDWVEGLEIKPESVDRSAGTSVTAIIGVEWSSNEETVSLIEAKCEELFRRDADVFSFETQSFMAGLPTWQDRAAEPAWKEFTISEPQ